MLRIRHHKHSARLLKLLVCPYDHSSLKGDLDTGLTCISCGREYPIFQGLVNFLAHEEAFKDLTYDLPHHPVASVGVGSRILTTIRRLPIYHRLLVTSDHFSFALERYLYKAVKTHRSVLDVGCREGTNLLFGDSRNDVCVGIDIDFKSAYFAQQMSSPNAFGLLASGTRLPFAQGALDLVICCDVIEHVEAYETLVSEMARVTEPNGELVLSTPDGDVRPKPAPYHVKHFKARELVDLLTPSFEKLDLRSVVRNCDPRRPLWKYQSRHPDRRFGAIALNAWTNLRYYLSGYNRDDAFKRQDVTDSTFIISARRKQNGEAAQPARARIM